jgi:hypothetical protein
MQDLAIYGTSDLKIFPGRKARTPNHSVRRWNHEDPQVKPDPGYPNFPGCCAVYVRFGILEYQLLPVLCGLHIITRKYMHAETLALLTKQASIVSLVRQRSAEYCEIKSSCNVRGWHETL